MLCMRQVWCTEIIQLDNEQSWIIRGLLQNPLLKCEDGERQEVPIMFM